MAFDRPIEADRVDDLGLLSSFVRAPVVGTLMWIFGGSEARKMELEDKDSRQHPVTLLESVSEEEEPTDEVHYGEEEKDSTSEKVVRQKSSSLPHMASIDLSEHSETLGDSPGQNEAYRDYDKGSISPSRVLPSKLRRKSFGGIGSVAENSPQLRRGSIKLKKKTSWSDETGHRSLVEYLGESQSELHEPPSQSSDPYASTKAIPVKPAIRQSSRSNLRPTGGNHLANANLGLPVRSAALGTPESKGTRTTPIHPSQCIPSGLGPNSAGSGGIIMPTGGGLGGPKRSVSASGGASGGYVSPQWGWYISTTPPTPEMYNQHPSSQQKKWLQSKSTVVPVENSAHVTVEGHSEMCGHSPQPVFTKGIKGVGTTPGLGWPSVPL